MIHRNFIQSREGFNGYLGGGSPVALAPRSLKYCDSAADRRALPWFYRAGWGAFLCALYPLLVVAPLVTVHALNRDAGYSMVTELGIDCAQVGFGLLAMQFLLTARFSWIEAPFGLDLILRFHRAMALVIVALLCAHPLLIASDQSWRLITRLHAHWYIWAGRIATLLLVAQVAAAFLRHALRLSYEWWRRAHNAVALAILVLGFVHAVVTGEDLNDAAGIAFWALVPALALGTWLYAHAIRPRLLARQTFRVRSFRLEAPRVWTVTLEGPGRIFRFLPGQFQFLRFLGSDVPAEEHPFSIASSPSHNEQIKITIKACGNFTNLIDRIQVGDRATVQGPFGRFSYDLHPHEEDLVFVAGGVGITPLMSMLRAMRDRRDPRRVTLIYASRKLDDICFILELFGMELGKHPALKVIYVLSGPPQWWTGETGRIDAARLDELCGGLEGKAFYICCPPQMNAELVRGLRHRRVSRRRIHCDYFSL